MATRILLVSLFLCLLTACDKKEDDNKPGKDYTGNLTLTYSRSFPTFQAIADIEVDIAENGVVTLSNPQQIEYDGLAEKMVQGDRIKIREQGTIIISSLSGKWISADGKEFLDVSLSCMLEGIQTVWAYDEFHWIIASEMPYVQENPVKCPMRFRIQSAVMSEAICGGSCSDCWGNSCFRWRLVLTPGN